MGSSPSKTSTASVEVITSKEVIVLSAQEKSTSTKLDALERVLVPTEFRPLVVTTVGSANHNFMTFNCAFPNVTAQLNTPTANFYLVRAEINGEVVVRPYTPVNPVNAKGYLSLLVKIYEDGKMGNHLKSLSVGDKLEFKGPLQKFKYEPNRYPSLYMICGGSGIAPMYQVLLRIWENDQDKTPVTLFFANREERDIVLREEIYKLKKARPEQLKIVLVLSQPHEEWDFEKGHINAEILRKHGLKCEKDDDKKPMIFVCGTPGFTATMAGPKIIRDGKPPLQGELKGIMKDFGFMSNNVFKF